MKGHSATIKTLQSPEVIKALQVVLTNELTSINQYFLHSRMCNDWGYEKIGEKIYKESADEMNHAGQIIDRMLSLEGLPDVQKLHPLNIGSTVKKQLESNFKLESTAIADLKESIKICIKTNDFTSRKLLEDILVTEEEHLDWLKTQLDIIQEIGEQSYLSLQVKA